MNWLCAQEATLLFRSTSSVDSTSSADINLLDQNVLHLKDLVTKLGTKDDTPRLRHEMRAVLLLPPCPPTSSRNASFHGRNRSEERRKTWRWTCGTV